MGIRGVKVLVAGLMTVGLMAACTSDPDPIVTETPLPTITPVAASPTPSPSPDAPLDDAALLQLLPQAADAPDVQGAVVTAQFFLELYAPMFHSGDTSVWDALSTEDCVYCASARGNALEVAEVGWTARGGHIKPRELVERAGTADDGITYVVLIADLDDAILVDEHGVESVSEVGTTWRFVMQMQLVGSVWRVSGVTPEEPT